MAWVEDAFGQVLLVRQAYGKHLWTLPGGKVKPYESIEAALRRELREETGYQIAYVCPVDLYDRPKKQTLTLLFRVLLKKGLPERRRMREVRAVRFHRSLPKNSTPSAQYFWDRASSSFEPMFMIAR